ncbi:hypothetical protein A2U01_0075064, partial [Trifolium medium]|nr:hypothetical protein [Trifolium medium]
ENWIGLMEVENTLERSEEAAEEEGKSE